MHKSASQLLAIALFAAEVNEHSSLRWASSSLLLLQHLGVYFALFSVVSVEALLSSFSFANLVVIPAA